MRRVDWSRRILRWICLFCLIGYVVMVVATFLVNNEGRAKETLAFEMKDVTAPVIELIGGDVSMAVGDSLVEPGYDIYDDRDVPKVEIESGVDVTREGEYEISYRVVDESGNLATASRKVKVIRPAGKIYLTFDDGPGDYTGTLLDILKKYGVKATFFVTGYGDDVLIQREYAEGHAVGLHTNTHDYAYIYSSMGNFASDLDAVSERVMRVTGKVSRLMRFPGGSSNVISARYDGGAKIMSALVDVVKDWGYTYFDWNVDSDDAGRADSAEQVYNNVVSTLKVGGDSIVLQHDTKPYSVEAVERIIQYGLENNYVFEKLNSDSFAAHHGVNN